MESAGYLYVHVDFHVSWCDGKFITNILECWEILLVSNLEGHNQFLLQMFKGARSRCFRQFCLILLIVSSKHQIGRPRVFHLQNHGHITTENDFPAVLMKV